MHLPQARCAATPPATTPTAAAAATAPRLNMAKDDPSSTTTPMPFPAGAGYPHEYDKYSHGSRIRMCRHLQNALLRGAQWTYVSEG